MVPTCPIAMVTGCHATWIRTLSHIPQVVVGKRIMVVNQSDEEEQEECRYTADWCIHCTLSSNNLITGIHDHIQHATEHGKQLDAVLIDTTTKGSNEFMHASVVLSELNLALIDTSDIVQKGLCNEAITKMFFTDKIIAAGCRPTINVDRAEKQLQQIGCNVPIDYAVDEIATCRLVLEALDICNQTPIKSAFNPMSHL